MNVLLNFNIQRKDKCYNNNLSNAILPLSIKKSIVVLLLNTIIDQELMRPKLNLDLHKQGSAIVNSDSSL